MVKPPVPTPRPQAPTERDRLTRPQPPAVIPPRGAPATTPAPGNLAYTLLGAQEIK